VHIGQNLEEIEEPNQSHLRQLIFGVSNNSLTTVSSYGIDGTESAARCAPAPPDELLGSFFVLPRPCFGLGVTDLAGTGETAHAFGVDRVDAFGGTDGDNVGVGASDFADAGDGACFVAVVGVETVGVRPRTFF